MKETTNLAVVLQFVVVELIFRAGAVQKNGILIDLATLPLPWSGPAIPVYRSREIEQSLTIDFVPLPVTAALDNSQHMDFSINPRINICSGREYTAVGCGKTSWPRWAGDWRTRGLWLILMGLGPQPDLCLQKSAGQGHGNCPAGLST